MRFLSYTRGAGGLGHVTVAETCFWEVEDQGSVQSFSTCTRYDPGQVA